jgi:general secretion pathway protein B
MSYILDALRRAEAERERERGGVPGVHAQPAVLPHMPARPRLQGPAWWAVAVGGSLGGAAAAVLWFAGRAPAVSAPSAPSVPVSVVPAAARAPAPSPASAPPAAPLAVVSAPGALPGAAAAPAASAATQPVATATPAAESLPQPWGQLSAEQKREWPALAIGGAVYSDNPGSRFVMINGQVVREGEAAAPGVTVERIGPKSAVLRWRGRRVELAF